MEVEHSWDRVLMLIVEEFAAFLDLNQPDELAPEVAELGRDRLKTLLSGLLDADKARLARFLEEESNLSTGSYRRWIEGLPGRLGLADPSSL